MPSRLRPSTRKALVLLLAAGASWGVAVLGLFGCEWARLRAGRGGATVEGGPVDPLVRFAMPGVDRPPAVEAGASGLRDDEEVIGVEAGGRARAYRLGALRDRSRHLVNDLVGGVPVSVAYCDLGDCVGAYTGPGRGRPLDLAVGGLFEGRELVLDVGGALYLQGSGASLSKEAGPASLPLDRLPSTRTTWGEWKRLHPSTDVCEGVP